MKKAIIVLIIITLMFQLTCCGKSENNLGQTAEMYTGVDVESSLSECLRTSYELESLQSFFGTVPENEYCIYNADTDHTALTMKDVNEAFPAECTRKAGQMPVYSVYSVKNGGYYYVFWSLADVKNPDEPNISEENINVCFSAYINTLPDADSFDSIVPDKSTAEDVSEIDGAVEISFLFSSGIYSFSLLKDGSVMKYTYDRPEKCSSRKDLVVKDAEILSHEDARSASYLSLIDKNDLP